MPHVVPVGSLPALDVPVRQGGLVVGQDPSGQPVILRLFRPAPVRIAVFGAGYFATLLSFRALAQGAQVVVVTARPARWAALVHAAPPGPAWVAVVPPASATPPAGSVLRPSLLVEDVEVGQGGIRHDLGSWQAALTLEPAVTDATIPAIRAFDLVVLARPTVAALRPLREVFRLPAEAVRWLPQMPDDVLALAAPGRCAFLRVVPSQVEQATFGTPAVSARPGAGPTSMSGADPESGPGWGAPGTQGL